MGERTEMLTRRVRQYMEKENMAVRGSRIIVGVSGGADSVCLLHILSGLSKEMDWKLEAVHVNHRIREEAGEDAEFVRRLCEQLDIPFRLKEADVEALARQQGISVEEAGRNVRYQAFAEAAEQFGADRIAVAHNRNDRAETLLFHLFRGTGLAGMASIRPKRDRIIRPLLAVGRAEIERWLREEGISWCSDRTNDTDEYTRNRIRRHILPYAAAEISAEADVHVAAGAELLAQAADLLNELTEEAMNRCCRLMQEDAIVIDAEAFSEERELIQTQMLYLLLKQLSGGGRDMTMVHVEQVRSLFLGQSGRKISLHGQLEAVRNFDEVILRKKKEERKTPLLTEFFGKDLKPVLDRNGHLKMELPGLGSVEYSLKKREKSLVIEEKTYTKWLDYDKIESLILRGRQPGDYLTVNDRFQKKSLKEYLIQEKIPADQRDRQLIFADGSHVLWVVGHRISSMVKITDSTERVLQIDIRGGEANG